MQKNQSTHSLTSENLKNYTSNAQAQTQSMQCTKSGLLSIHKQSDHFIKELQTSYRTLSVPDCNKMLPITINDTAGVIQRRKKKRAWQKRRRERFKIEKIKTLLIRKEKDKKIDQNLALEKEREEKEQRARQLAFEAQEGLSELTEKINDAENYISHLKLRISQKKTVNIPYSVDDDQCISIETEKELSIWQQKLENYKIEERSLKKQIIAGRSSPDFHWCQALFGCSSLTDNSSSKKTFDEFVELRRSWDSHLVPAEKNFGSQIPIGWVMPNTNPTPSWSAYRN